jgi:hypothetical protein
MEKDSNLITDIELLDILIKDVMNMFPEEVDEYDNLEEYDMINYHAENIEKLAQSSYQEISHEELQDKLNNANNTKESIIAAIHALPYNSPFRKSLISIIAPNYRTQEEIAKDTKFSKNLISRSVNMKESECVLRTTKYTPYVKKPHKATTDNLKLAYEIVDELIPLNSVHVRITTATTKQLYQDYISSLPPEIVIPLGPAYFRRMLREMTTRHVKCIMQCKYCFDYKNQHKIEDEERLLKCLLHQHILGHQKKAYLADKVEIKENKLGMRVFGKPFPKAALVITDFTLLSPSTSRHQDMIFHIYKSDHHGGLTSSVIHYVGEDDQKNNASFSIDGLKEVVHNDLLNYCDLIVFYSDGGPKHYKLGVIMDCMVEIEKEKGVKLVWNFFASNHGGGAADGDGQTAQRHLARYVKHNREILNNNTDKVVSLINQIKSHYASSAKEFRKYTNVSEHEMKGIKKKHCFIVKDGHAVGFTDSMNLSDPTVFTYTPIDHPEWFVHPAPVAGSRTQDALKIRSATDPHIKHCTKCDYYYIKEHKKCRNNTERKRAPEPDSEESSDSLIENEEENEEEDEKVVHRECKRKINEIGEIDEEKSFSEERRIRPRTTSTTIDESISSKINNNNNENNNIHLINERELGEEKPENLVLVSRPIEYQRVWSPFYSTKGESFWLSGIVDKVNKKTCVVTYSDNQQLMRTRFSELYEVLNEK